MYKANKCMPIVAFNLSKLCQNNDNRFKVVKLKSYMCMTLISNHLYDIVHFYLKFLN